MTHRYLIRLAISAAVLLASAARADIIPDIREVDWSVAGVVGGIPNRTTISTTLSAGATATQINAAIAACATNEVVKLGLGTFDLDAYLNVGGGDKGVTLRGSGTGTVLRASSADIGGRYIIFGPYTSETGPVVVNNGFHKGSSNITVASASGIVNLQMIRLTPENDTNFVRSFGSPATNMVTHIAQIKAISGNDITFWPPLIWGTNAAFPTAYLYHYGGSVGNHVEMSGVEDLLIDGTTNPQTVGIDFQQSCNVWMKNVKLRMINNYHVRIQRSVNGTAIKNFLDDSPSYLPNHGGFLIGPTGHREACTAWRFEDNLVPKLNPSVELQAGSALNVIAYNFFPDTRYSTTTQGRGIYINHEPHPMMNLYEGNVVNSVIDDALFGSASHQTLFRNWITSWTPTYGSTNGFGVNLCIWSLSNNIVGNVFGVTNFTFPHYIINENTESGELGTDETWTHVYRFGWPNDSSYTSIRPPSTDATDALDLAVEDTVLLHGNWDNVNGQLWDGGIADHNIPASMYLTSKPDWFYSMTWPPFDPANGYTNLTFGTSIPAAYRYYNAGQDPPAAGPGNASITAENVTVNGIKLQ